MIRSELGQPCSNTEQRCQQRTLLHCCIVQSTRTTDDRLHSHGRLGLSVPFFLLLLCELLNLLNPLHDNIVQHVSVLKECL